MMKSQNKITHTVMIDRSPDSWTVSADSPLIFGKTGRMMEKPQRTTIVFPSDILLFCNSHHFPGAPV